MHGSTIVRLYRTYHTIVLDALVKIKIVIYKIQNGNAILHSAFCILSLAIS